MSLKVKHLAFKITLINFPDYLYNPGYKPLPLIGELSDQLPYKLNTLFLRLHDYHLIVPR
jgi:hypothetical protein